MNELRFTSGLANCHLPGLYSLAISERVSSEVGMRRVFYCGADCRMDLWDGADFRIKPHNHRQDITLTLLFGKVDNHVLKVGFGEMAVWKYGFGSALLNGEFSLSRMNREDAQLREQPITRGGLFMEWNMAHTVTARKYSAWLVEEGCPAPPGMERCWSISHRLTLSSEGLYQPMDAAQLKVVGDEINRHCALRVTEGS